MWPDSAAGWQIGAGHAYLESLVNVSSVRQFYSAESSWRIPSLLCGILLKRRSGSGTPLATVSQETHRGFIEPATNRWVKRGGNDRICVYVCWGKGGGDGVLRYDSVIMLIHSSIRIWFYTFNEINEEEMIKAMSKGWVLCVTKQYKKQFSWL